MLLTIERELQELAAWEVPLELKILTVDVPIIGAQRMLIVTVDGDDTWTLNLTWDPSASDEHLRARLDDLMKELRRRLGDIGARREEAQDGP